MNRILFVCPLAALVGASAFAVRSAHAEQHATEPMHYTVTDLGLANGSTPGQPFQIRNDGLIAGSAQVSGAWHATLWLLGWQIDAAKNGGLGGPNSSASAVNLWGQVAGEAETGAADPKSEDFCGFGTGRVCDAFFWQGGTMWALPPLKDSSGNAGRNSVAKAINNVGQIAGTAENTTADTTCPPYNPTDLQFQTYQFKPVIWAQGGVHPLPTSGTDAHGSAFNDPDGVVFRINDSGQAVGATGNCTAYTPFLTYLNSVHATLWQNGKLTDLGSLGAPAPGVGNFAYDINRSGHVVGTSGTSDGSFHAFYWSAKTLIQDLGTVPGDVASAGLAISDNGDIGGVSFPADPTASPRAFIRPSSGAMLDLNTLIPVNSPLYLFSVCSINARGEIIGLALDVQGNYHAYLATPANQAAGFISDDSARAHAAEFEHAWSLLRDHAGSFGAALPNRR